MWVKDQRSGLRGGGWGEEEEGGGIRLGGLTDFELSGLTFGKISKCRTGIVLQSPGRVRQNRRQFLLQLPCLKIFIPAPKFSIMFDILCDESYNARRKKCTEPWESERKSLSSIVTRSAFLNPVYRSNNKLVPRGTTRAKYKHNINYFTRNYLPSSSQIVDRKAKIKTNTIPVGAQYKNSYISLHYSSSSLCTTDNPLCLSFRNNLSSMVFF